jgi:hypothetical protein
VLAVLALREGVGEIRASPDDPGTGTPPT